jgi:hypothetical protein
VGLVAQVVLLLPHRVLLVYMVQVVAVLGFLLLVQHLRVVLAHRA